MKRILLLILKKAIGFALLYGFVFVTLPFIILTVTILLVAFYFMFGYLFVSERALIELINIKTSDALWSYSVLIFIVSLAASFVKNKESFKLLMKRSLVYLFWLYVSATLLIIILIFIRFEKDQLSLSLAAVIFSSSLLVYMYVVYAASNVYFLLSQITDEIIDEKIKDRYAHYRY